MNHAPILDDIAMRLVNETRSVPALYAEMKDKAWPLLTKNEMNREMVVTLCSDFIKIYQLLTKEQ